MRISDQRYAKDRRALDVATRLIDFEARTNTIRRLTGLADGRIRSLSKACGVNGRSGTRLRHRGASPHSVTVLLGKARLKNEAAALLGLCQLMGISMEASTAVHRWNRVSRAERLCDAFWTFRYLVPEAAISFEHMLLLLSEASKGDELAITHCRKCKALLVVDPLALYSSVCPHCAEDAVSCRLSAEPMQYRRVAEELPAYQ